MSYFNKDLPEWNNEGTEPPQSKKNEGWKASDKPPAQWFNWLFNRAYEAIIELRNVLTGHIDNKNNPHEVTKTQVGLGNVENVKAPSETAFNEHRNAATIDHPDNSVTDAKVGNRTINDAVANPTANTGTITQIVSWFGNRIRAITGKEDWKTAPRTTLENAVKRDGDTMTGDLTVTKLNGMFPIDIERVVYSRQFSDDNQGVMFNSNMLADAGTSVGNQFKVRVNRLISNMNLLDELTVRFHIRRGAGGSIAIDVRIDGIEAFPEFKFYYRVLQDNAELYIMSDNNFTTIKIVEDARNYQWQQSSTGRWSNFDDSLPDDVVQVTPRKIWTERNSDTIVEKGSNSNGEYIRFSDGTQICWGNSASLTATISFPPSFRTDLFSVTFPAAFVDVPRVTTACRSTNLHMYAFATQSVLTTGMTSCLMLGTESGATGVMMYQAIGRWK